MPKYYKVLINERFVGYEDSSKNIDNENYIICRFYPLLSALKSRFIFKEIITDKIVLDSTDTPIKGLTLAVVRENNINVELMPCVKSVSTEEVQEWLKNMDEKYLKEYVDRLNILEGQAINYYEQERVKAIEREKQEKVANKSFRRNLRKR